MIQPGFFSKNGHGRICMDVLHRKLASAISPFSATNFAIIEMLGESTKILVIISDERGQIL
jgi:hypothetical protein